MAFSLLMQTLHGGSVPAVSMLPLRCENINCRRAPWSEAGQGSVRNFSATFAPGELAGFCGPDGSGKGLLLRVLGMIDKPDSGFLEVLGKNVFAMPEDDARAWRDAAFGYLFTHPHLLPSLTIAENVAMPFLRFHDQDALQARRRTLEALEFTGISELHSLPVSELDVDTSWLVAMARAVIHRPALLVATSPTSPLLLPLARRMADDFGTTVLWNGQKNQVAPYADRLLEMEEGLATLARP